MENNFTHAEHSGPPIITINNSISYNKTILIKQQISAHLKLIAGVESFDFSKIQSEKEKEVFKTH